MLWGADATMTRLGQERDPASPSATAAGSPTNSTRSTKMVDGKPVDIPLNLMMINDIALANVAGEVFTEISQKRKRPIFPSGANSCHGTSLPHLRPTPHRLLSHTQQVSTKNKGTLQEKTHPIKSRGKLRTLTQKLKRESLFDRTVMVTLSNGRVGYISVSVEDWPSGQCRMAMGAERPVVSTCFRDGHNRLCGCEWLSEGD